MNTLLIDRERKFRIVEQGGKNYILVMSGGVFEQEIAIALAEDEVAPLLSDEAKRTRLADLIVRNPEAFEERRVRPSVLP